MGNSSVDEVSSTNAQQTTEKEGSHDRPVAVVQQAPNPLEADLDQVLDQTRELWEELRGMRLFLTGGTGFFGCWLLESFAWACDRLALGAEMVVLTRRPEAFARKAAHLASHPAIRLHRGDIRSFAFPQGAFSHVLHAATETSTTLNERDPLEMLDTIVQGTRRALDFAVDCHAEKFLFTSSGAVYGSQPPEITHLREDYPGAPDPMDPRSAYGEGKRIGELLCANYARKHGIKVKLARCFAFMGPYLPLEAHFAIGNFIRDALAGGPINVEGDGRAYRSYLYAADLMVWLWTILIRGENCRIYNVGSADGITISELANSVAEAAPTPMDVRIAQAPRIGAATQRYVPSTDRARTELGLRPSHELMSGIRRTLAYHLRRAEGLRHSQICLPVEKARGSSETIES